MLHLQEGLVYFPWFRVPAIRGNAMAVLEIASEVSSHEYICGGDEVYLKL